MSLLQELRSAWIAAKAEENDARARRVDVEKQIAEIYGDLPVEGRVHPVEGMTIATRLNRKWDQSLLRELHDSVPERLFPFKVEFVEDRTKARFIEMNEPDLWKYLRAALTLTPAKPSFTYKAPDE